MKLDDDFNESWEKGKFRTTVTAWIIVLTVAVVLFVLIINADKIKKAASKTQTASMISEINETIMPSVSEEIKESEPDYTPSSLTPGDLDFFDMYPEDDDETDASLTESQDEEEENTNPATDGKHTLIKNDDGTEEWVELSKYITQNNYDYTNLQDQDGIKEYLKNDRVISFFGVDVSKEQDYIDYIKLQKAGVDFVMIRVGARGYSSGNLTMDEYFEDNIRRASNAGLGVGVYFLSQALTEEEAEEEAQLVADSVVNYNLTYPVAYVMEYPENESCRAQSLTKAEKTTVARAFLKKVEEAGYKPMIYGTKTWLFTKLELNKIVCDYDVWLSEEEDMPTYPYEFTMWQYNKNGEISGIKGEVAFNLCFVDYSIR